MKPEQPRIVVVTGASSGFGRGTAVALAQRGNKLVLAARRESLLEALAEECRVKGGEAIVVPTDVGDPAQVEALSQRAIAAFGHYDVWINVAGVAAIGRFEEIPLEDHWRVVTTNLLGTLHGSHIALKHFRERSMGALINVASMLGKVPAPYYASYNATKSAIVALDATLRQELSENGEKHISVSTVLPMAFDTPFFQHAANYTGRKSLPIPPVYDAAEVVDALVALLENPKDETIVGSLGIAANIAHHLMPGMAEMMTAKEVQYFQMDHAPASPPTSGNLHSPVMAGDKLYSDEKA